MAEVVAEFDPRVVGPQGRVYQARACAATMDDGTGHWMGWIEFVPLDGTTPLRTRRETTQPNRADVVYWATGLTPVYLAGALERALNPIVAPPAVPVAPPAFDTPAPDFVTADDAPTSAVLNPFSVYQKGEALLRRQLTAFAPWHLLNIIDAYDLSTEDPVALQQMSAPALIELIVVAVRQRA